MPIGSFPRLSAIPRFSCRRFFLFMPFYGLICPYDMSRVIDALLPLLVSSGPGTQPWIRAFLRFLTEWSWSGVVSPSKCTEFFRSGMVRVIQYHTTGLHQCHFANSWERRGDIAYTGSYHTVQRNTIPEPRSFVLSL